MKTPSDTTRQLAERLHNTLFRQLAQIFGPIVASRMVCRLCLDAMKHRPVR